MDDLGIPFDKNQPFRWVLRLKRGAQPAPVETTEPTAIELDYQALIPPPMSAREYIQSEGQMIAPKERTLKICRPAKSIDWVYVRQSWLKKCPKKARNVEEFLLDVDDFAFELQKEAAGDSIEDNSFALEAAIILRFHAWSALSLLHNPETKNAVARFGEDLMKLYNAILHPIQQQWDAHDRHSAEGGRASAEARAAATKADDGLRSRIITKYRELRDSGKAERSIAAIVSNQLGCAAAYVRKVAKESGLK